MPYALSFADTAVEDLERLIESLRPNVREEAIDGVEAACQALANMSPPPAGHLKVPSFPVHFCVGETHYYWGGTYRITEDERSIVVTHLVRLPL
jgi:hypothetical protein